MAQAATDKGWLQKASDDAGLLAVREAFLRHLVRLTEGDEPSRRQARRRDLPPRSLAALDKLVEARLLVASSDAPLAASEPLQRAEGEPTLEIAHEAVLRTWPTLKTWIDEGREELLQCRRVKRLADDLVASAAPRQCRQALEQLAGDRKSTRLNSSHRT